jgi:SAM-dependent methyltransferase
MLELKDVLSEKFDFKSGIWYSNITKKDLSYPTDCYDTYFEVEEESFWFRHRKNILVLLIKRLSSFELFFDIGGGNGYITKSLQDNGINSVLVEPGQQGVVNARNRNVNQIICGTSSDLLHLSGEISAIGAFDVIEHIEDDDLFVSDLSKLLKKDGLLYITVPAFYFLWSNDDVAAGHFRRYTTNSISELLQRNGLEIVYLSYFFSVLILPLFFLRTLASKLGLRSLVEGKVSSEHKQGSGLFSKFLDFVWKMEMNIVSKQRIIPFGTSCLCVARKL